METNEKVKRGYEQVEDLLQLRHEIDEIDQEMVRLFEQRMDVSRRVAEYKIANGKKILDRAWENWLTVISTGMECRNCSSRLWL